MNAFALILAAVTLVQGTIVDLYTNRPIAGVRIQAQTPAGTFTTLTASDGTFRLWAIPLGRTKMTFDGPGYSPASGTLCLKPGDVRTFHLSLAGQGSIPMLVFANHQLKEQERAAELLDTNDGTTLTNC